jgi:hypothetical protein
MDGRFPAYPLDVACASALSPFDGIVKEAAGQPIPAGGIKRIDARNTKTAAQITTRKVKQVRGDQVQFLAVFNSVSENVGDCSGFAEAEAADRAINTAAVLTKGAVRVRRQCSLQSVTTHPIWSHGLGDAAEGNARKKAALSNGAHPKI